MLISIFVLCIPGIFATSLFSATISSDQPVRPHQHEIPKYDLTFCVEDHFKGIKGWMIDLSGVVYDWKGLLPGAETALSILSEYQVPHVFISNALQSPERVMRKFEKGAFKATIPPKAANIHTVAVGLSLYMSNNAVSGTHILFVGLTPEEVNELFSKEYLNIWTYRTAITAEETLMWAAKMKEGKTKVMVVVGMSDSPFEIDFELIANVGILLRNGGQLVACGGNRLTTGPPSRVNFSYVDSRWPNVAIIEALFSDIGTSEKSVGSGTKVNIGKGGNAAQEYMFQPSFRLLKEQRPDLNLDQVAILGDSVISDVAFANQSGIKSILVLSGIASLGEVSFDGIRPTCYVNKISDVVQILANKIKGKKTDGQRSVAEAVTENIISVETNI